MSDRAVVAIACAAALGAWFAREVPVGLVAAVVVLACVSRWPMAIFIAVALVSSLLAGRAWDGLDPARLDAKLVDGVATLVGDPIRIPGGAQADVRLGDVRLRASARAGPAVAVLVQASAGERVRLRGRWSAFDDATRQRLAWRHLAGRLTVTSAERVDGGSVLARAANGFRRTLVGGAGSLPPSRRALYAGVVLGDDREQDPADVEDFRASGLTHLLAVSGQNVAFLLAIASPAVRRLRPRGRLLAGVALLVVFGAVTRWEPSVLRAVAMSGVTLVATTVGRPATSMRVLALAVGALLLVDPLLVHSLGFVLSVGACAGIAVLAPRFRVRMPEPLAVTLAAQVGVLPALVSAFGGVPLVSVPANLLAVPAAGPLMAWGVAAGAIAGALGPPFATLLHLPTHALVAWIATVARVAASLPVGRLTAGAIGVVTITVAVAAIVACLARVEARRAWRVIASAAMVVVVAVGLWPAFRPTPAMAAVLDGQSGDRLWRRGRAVVVATDGRARPGRLLGALRERSVDRIDLLVLLRPSRQAAASVRPVLDRMPTTLVLAPEHHQLGGAHAVGERMTIALAGWRIDVVPAGTGLRVRIGSLRAARARPP